MDAEPLSVQQFRTRAASALTTYDRMQSQRKGYNPNALAAYLGIAAEAGFPAANPIVARLAIADAFCEGSRMRRIIEQMQEALP